jgi:hypothetical protein
MEAFGDYQRRSLKQKGCFPLATKALTNRAEKCGFLRRSEAKTRTFESVAQIAKQPRSSFSIYFGTTTSEVVLHRGAQIPFHGSSCKIRQEIPAHAEVQTTIGNRNICERHTDESETVLSKPLGKTNQSEAWTMEEHKVLNPNKVGIRFEGDNRKRLASFEAAFAKHFDSRWESQWDRFCRQWECQKAELFDNDEVTGSFCQWLSFWP